MLENFESCSISPQFNLKDVHGRYMNIAINSDDSAAGLELERRDYEANALVIEPRWLTLLIMWPMMINKVPLA